MRVAPIAEIAQWDAFVADHPYAWFTHERQWCVEVDAAAGAGDLSFGVYDGESLRAVVPCTLVRRDDSPPLLVSGVLEPAGVLADPALPDDQFPPLWRALDSRLTDLAQDTGATSALFRFPVLGRHGHRAALLDRLTRSIGTGWRVVSRDFYCMDLRLPRETLFRAVSSRMRGQINRALRECDLHEVRSAEDMSHLYRIYHAHAAAKGTQVLPREHLERLIRSEAVRTHALIARWAGTPAAFAITLGSGPSATLFAWGSVPELQRSQVSKYVVWQSLMFLKEHGYSMVEYGGAMPAGSGYDGLTEFYRRLGGRLLAITWLYRRFSG